MPTLAYPSAEFPGPPAVSLDVPDGWEPAHAPGTTLAARLPRPDGFAPTVVVTVEPCLPTYSVDESLAQIESLATAQGGVVSQPYAAGLGGVAFVGCDATWPDETVETILQANLFNVVAPTGRSAQAHLVQLTGAVGGSNAEADYELVREVITTVRVAPWTAPEGGA